MPRPGPRRPQAIFRISADGLAIIDRLAEDAGVDRSEMIRRLLVEAFAVRRITADL